MGKYTIVVIDDDEAIRDACLQALGRNPEYQITTAADGPQGLELVGRLNPELALVDLKLPGMDGMEVVRNIAKSDPNVVSIIITGYPTIAVAVEALKQGAYDFLPKPFTPDELRMVVKRGLDKRRLESETQTLWRERQSMQRRFVSLVAHELRAPLNAIEQYVEALLAGTTGDVPPKQGDILRRIQARSSELRELVNSWLDLNRLQSGSLTTEMKPVRLSELAQETTDILRASAEENGVRFHLDFPQEETTVLGDRRCLKEMLINLVDNGVKYNKSGGSITIRSRIPANGRITVEIADTGRGIPENELPHIFEEFFRGNNGSGPQAKGSGLGLALVRQIVELHAGSIEVSSRVGEGSVFSVSLPTSNPQRRTS